MTMTRDINNITNCTNSKLRKATRLVAQAFDTALQPAGLKSTQFTLLATLRAMGNPPLTKLAEAMVMDRTTLTRNLKPLINKGLIQVRSEEDRRVKQIQLMPEGEQVLAEAMPYWLQVQKRVVDQLGEERWAQLLEDLEVAVDVIKVT